MIRKLKNRILPKGIYIKKGLVYVRIMPNGRRFVQCFGKADVASNVNAAIAKLNEYRELIRCDKFDLDTKAKRIRFSDAVLLFSEKVGKTYQYQTPALVAFFGELWFDDITPLKTSNYRPYRKGQGITDSTVNRELAALRTIYNKLKRMVQLKEIAAIKLPEVRPTLGVEWYDERKSRRKRVLGEDEFQVFMRVASERVQRVCLAALNTALRRKDLFALTPATMNSSNGFLQGVQAKTGNEYVVPGNSNVVQLFQDSDGTASVLDSTGFREAFEADRDKFLEQYPENERAKRFFQFRDLRRTALMKVYQKTKDIILCKDLAGHTNITTTQLYLGLTEGDIKEAGKVLEDAFSYSIRTDTKSDTSQKAIGFKSTENS